MKPSDIVDQIIQGRLSSEAAISAQLVLATQPKTEVSIPDYRDGDIPMRADLEDPILELIDETRSKVEDNLPELEVKMVDGFNWRASAILGLQAALKSTQSKVVSLQLTASDSESAFLWAADTLQTLDHVEESQTSALVFSGRATLSPSGETLLNSEIESIKIDKAASNGLPGNHTTIAHSGAAGTSANVDTEPTVELVADSDPHANISYMLDNSPQTWFEWEKVYIPRNQKVKKVGAALVTDKSGDSLDIYKETGDKGWGWFKYVQWPGETTWDTGSSGQGLAIADFDVEIPVRLQFTLVLKKPTQVSHLELTPVLQGGQYPIVRKLQVSPDGTNWVDLAKDVYLSEKLNEALNSRRVGLPEGNYAGVGVWGLGDRYIQQVRFTLETTGGYTPELKFGHRFYYQVIQKHKSGGWLTKGKTWVETKRYPNPQAISSVSTNGNGMSFGEMLGAAGAVIASGGSLGWAAIGAQLWNSAFGGKVTSQELESGSATDIFDGKRQAIAIKDIVLARRTYDQTSQLVSKAFVFPGPVKAVSIITTEDIPSDWGNEKEWLTYYVSPDGNNWTPIVPQQRSGGVGDVVEMETRTVYLKVGMTRPDGREGETPSLLSYAIKGLP